GDRHASLRELRAELRELLAVKDPSPMPSVVGRATGTELDAAAALAVAAAARNAVSKRQFSSEEAPSSIRRWENTQQGPDWLERGPLYATSSQATYAATAPNAPAPPPTIHDEIADQLAFDAQGWLRKFARTPDPRAFAQLA